MGVRYRSIRFRVLAVLVIPVLSLVGVYAFAAGPSGGGAVRLARAARITALIGVPGATVAGQLAGEGLVAASYLAAPAAGSLGALRRQEASTDRAVRRYQAAVRSAAVASDGSAAEQRAVTAAARGLARLPAVRAGIGARRISGVSAAAFYNSLAVAGFRVYDGPARQAAGVALATGDLDVAGLGEADQLVLQETGLLTGSVAAGSLTAAGRAEFTGLAGARRFLAAQALAGLRTPDRGRYGTFLGPRSASLTSAENVVISGPRARGRPAVSPPAWNAAAGGYARGLAAARQEAANEIAAQAQDQARATYRRLALTGSLGLLAILASLAVSLMTARRVTGQLAELRQSALELASDRLPGVMRRLRQGEHIDLAAEVPALQPGDDEIGQVRQAFEMVGRAAIETAASEARLRQGASGVFRNLARRSQALLHRQLTLLDDLERRAAGPGELENLFRIDHLATRMRRQAESLIILSGELPGRGWRDPVPLVDVLRAAQAEVEGFTRIQVVEHTRAALAGEAVADVIHLVAELAENAIAFSPPDTPVRILGDVVDRRFAIEIEDRGPGLPDERLAEINRDLARPAEPGLPGSDRIGLFIAGQLAQRHEIKITLRHSSFGGTSAVILIPQDLIVPETADPSDAPPAGNSGLPVRRASRDASPSKEAGPSGAESPQRHAPAEPAEPVAPADPDQIDLPVRVRQASIAPQLRGAADARLAPDASAGPASPEAARSTMAAMQQGWERGRADSADSGGPDRADQSNSDR
jgi:signal transduction histidine kinase